jgi:hypothetical protein
MGGKHFHTAIHSHKLQSQLLGPVNSFMYHTDHCLSYTNLWVHMELRRGPGKFADQIGAEDLIMERL